MRYIWGISAYAGIMRYLPCIVLLCVLSSPYIWAFDPADPTLRMRFVPVVETPAQTPPPKNREELFQEVFKRPSPKIPLEMVVPLIVQGKSYGKIKLIFSEDRTNFFFSASPFVSALTDIIKPDVLTELGKKIDSEGMLSKQACEETGIIAAFDTRRFLLTFLVPDDLQGAQIHHITGIRIDPALVNALRPNPFSGYVNMSTKERWYYPQQSALSNDHRAPAVMDFDSAWNWHSLVLEGSASYLESFDHPLQRHDMRLVYDSPKDLVRYSAGDLLYPLVGYQTTVNMGGVSVSRDFSLQPYINAYPVSQFEFYLDTPATVDVWVNETLTSTLHLNPGTHDIRDFPFSTGQNDVKIVITDIYGRVQELRFSFIQETSLLAPGLSQFSYNGGFLRTIKDSSYRYESDEPVVSLFYRKGMSDVYTLGGYMQCLKDQGLAGFEGLYAIPMGTLQFDTAVSAVKEADWGMASKLTFTHRPYTVRYSTDVSWQLGIEFLGQGFSRITNPCPEHNASLNLSSYVNFPIGYGFSSGIGAGYAFRWDHRPNKYNLSGSITRTWFSNLNSNLTLQYKRDEIRDREVDAFFGLVWMFPVKNQSVSLSMASKGNLNLQWDYNQTTSVPERVYASASTNRSSCENKYEAKMGYIGNRGIVEVSQRLIDPHGYDDHALNNQTDVTLQSALVYVDGNWALSRPVSQGFVLVKGVKNLNDSVIAVNPNGDDGYQAISSRYGPAVLPSLSPYNVKKVEVQPMDPPAGYLLENSKFILFPTYKSGYALYVGSDSMVVIIGSIVDGTSGQPFGHQIIEIISLDDKKAKPFQTFTNRKGQFQLLGLKPGNYEIRVDESTGLSAITFELHEGTEGIYRIGTLALPKKP